MGYITIDVGTSNTRVRYIEGEKIISNYSSGIGVKDTAIKGTLQYLKSTLKEGIEHCLRGANKNLDSVEGIIAYGMITSNLGISEIPHLEAPVNLECISQNIEIRLIDEIIEKPIYFIPGIKNRVANLTLDTFRDVDMMRGEEVEVFGAILMGKKNKNLLYISPGSHTKFVFLNNSEEIEGCSTTLTGEILWALSTETILAQSMDKDLVKEVDKKYVIRGIKSVENSGFTKTCFNVRLMDTFLDSTANQRANYLAGALIYEDIKAIKDFLEDEKWDIIIGGKRILRELYHVVFQEIGYDMNKVKTLNDQEVELLSSIGAIEILKRSKVEGEDK